MSQFQIAFKTWIDFVCFLCRDWYSDERTFWFINGHGSPNWSLGLWPQKTPMVLELQNIVGFHGYFTISRFPPAVMLFVSLSNWDLRVGGVKNSLSMRCLIPSKGSFCNSATFCQQSQFSIDCDCRNICQNDCRDICQNYCRNSCWNSCRNICQNYCPARARSVRARRACALRALGLLLADGAPTVGLGKTFWRVGRVLPTKTGVTRKRKIAQ